MNSEKKLAKTPPSSPNKFTQLFDYLNQPTDIDYYLILQTNLMPYLVEVMGVIPNIALLSILFF